MLIPSTSFDPRVLEFSTKTAEETPGSKVLPNLPFMGCAESRQELQSSESSSQPLLSSFSPDDDPILMPPRMGQPAHQSSQQPLAGSVQLSSQHERLILELLPFKDLRQFHE